MRNRVLVLVCFISLVSLSSATQRNAKVKSCEDTAVTQGDINDCAYKAFTDVDKQLNDVYQAVLKKYSGDPELIEKLRASQKAWIVFRDAELTARYVHSGQYGSVEPMCHSIIKKGMTEERIKELKVWLDGIEEGDVCSGAIATKKAKAKKVRKPL